ncbi:MAG: ATP-binding protein [Acidobacteriota bacterium]|nr:ATP-binding protein [Acidobacteriota bacterium]
MLSPDVERRLKKAEINLRLKPSATIYFNCATTAAETALIKALRQRLEPDFKIHRMGYTHGSMTLVYMQNFQEDNQIFVVDGFPHAHLAADPDMLRRNYLDMVHAFNLHRQLIPEYKLKIVFILPVPLESLIALEAPDFYHFKHFTASFTDEELGVESDSNRNSVIRTQLSRLPAGSPYLFGRDKELAVLDRAWEDRETRIMCVVAWGGTGKTNLVNHWLQNVRDEGWRGAQAVYGWSFYSQGASEDRQASADSFLDHALRWFGDPNPEEGNPWVKGERLAELIAEQRVLLILDGIEPLQYPPGPSEGRLRDAGLIALLRELAHNNPGLCLLTSRLDLSDLESHRGKSLKQMDLEELDVKAGTQLLRQLEIEGNDHELEAAVKEVEGHALSLTLLGTFLGAAHGGNIQMRDRIDLIARDETRQGNHTFRILESYAHWLGDGPELALLHLIGLFDRPAEHGALEILYRDKPIDGLTDRLHGLDSSRFDLVIVRLRTLRLLATDDWPAGSLDAHPLVREHFGRRLEEILPEAFREAHTRLFHYYQSIPEKAQPDTLQELEPLYRAVHHGCKACLWQKAFQKVYIPRIARGLNNGYSVMKLGGLGQDLAGLKGFFYRAWDQPSEVFSEVEKGELLGRAGLCLLGLGRLEEAKSPMELAYERFAESGHSEDQAYCALNMLDIHYYLGNLESSLQWAERTSGDSDKSKVVSYLSQAWVKFNLGQINYAYRIYKKHAPISSSIFPWHTYFLLELGQFREAQRQMSRIISSSLIFDGTCKLLLARANHQAWKHGEMSRKKIGSSIKEALTTLRKSGKQTAIPEGLIARAAFYRDTDRLEEAGRDLAEAREIAERGRMRLHIVDILLEEARLAEAHKDAERAAERYDRARELIKATGYNLRLKQLPENRAKA